MRRFALLLVWAALPLAARHETVLCGTTRETGREARFLHRQTVRARAGLRPRASALPPADRDAGEIAVIEDTDGVVARQNQFNLDRNTLAFTPLAADASAYRYAVSAQGYDPAAASAGVPLTGLGDDDTRAVDLPFAFPFFGANYRRVFVNSDGNLTFTAGDTDTSLRSLGRATAGPPRLAPLFDDLDPSQAPDSVRVFLATGRAVVSWTGVPEWQRSGIGTAQTFQVRLYDDGRIEFAYAGANPADAVVGIASGGLRGTASLVDFRADSGGSYTAAVAERFSSTLSVDVVTVAQRFYQTHEDAYDYLAIYNDMDIQAMSGAVAYEITVRRNGSGYGAEDVEEGAGYGSPSRLHAVLNLGPLSEYPLDPDGLVTLRAQAGDTPVTILGHETGHLYLAYASVRDPARPDARPMLNTDLQHWSFVFNSEASLVEGERIADRGPGVSPRFVTTDTAQGYSPLDQYLMGFAPPEQAPPSFLVTGVTPALLSSHPARGVGFDGSRRDVSVQEVVAAEGRRIPDDTVAQRHFRFAFILVVAQGTAPSAQALAQLDNYRQRFEDFFGQAASYRAAADTTLKRSMKLSLSPAAGVPVGGAATATLTLATPPESAMVIELSGPQGYAAVPAWAAIPAGGLSATFAVAGLRTGVEEIAATPPVGMPYETAHARLQVADAARLQLDVVSGDGQVPLSGGPLPEPIVVRLTDGNRLPYPGATIAGIPEAGGVVLPTRAATDEHGVASFRWTPGAGPVNRLRMVLERMPEVGAAVSVDRSLTAIAEAVNAASWAAGVAPGGLGTILGANLAGGQTLTAGQPWPLHLGGVAVRLNGLPVPLLYVSDGQINFYVPPATRPGTPGLEVTTPSGLRATATVAVTPAAPGIFPGGVVRSGDLLQIYCTGLGAARPSDLTVWIGAAGVTPSDSREVSGTPGVYQVNAQVPPGISPGIYPVVLSVGLARSNPIWIEQR